MSDPKPLTGIAGFISQLLAYIDKPWKVGAIVVLFIVGGVGWFLYDKRDELFETWLTPSKVILDTPGVPAALEKLVVEAGADLAQIWEVDLSANSQRFIAARRKDGERPVIPEPRRLPVIVRASDLQVLADVIAGHPSCVNIVLPSPSPVVQRLAERGMKRGCAIPIPPTPDAFVGVIYMTWIEAQGPSAEDVALSAAREIANKLVKK